jgi:S1-C subfamily serine protease
MKSFRFYKSELNFKKSNLKKSFEIFRVFKKPLILTILVSVLVAGLVSFIVTALSVSYFKPCFQEIEGIVSTRPVKNIPQVVKEVSPAVVSVIVSKLVPIIEQDYYNPFGEDSPFKIRIPILRQKGEELKEIGGGSGLIVSSDGLIVTNKHVVLDEESEYTVLTNDGQKYPASVLDRDPIQDIAILKIDARDLPTIKLGNSNSLEIGQTVIAIGNALGQFRNTVSVGVISGLLRTITATGGGITEQLEEVIQTDAAINRGNSGGPLLNLYGEVVGVNTAVATEAENIGFAIPINKVKKDIIDVKAKSRIVYPFLGIRYILITEAIAKSKNLPVNYGVLIVKGDRLGEVAVTPDSAADRAGLKEGDIILEFNRVKINEKNTLAKLISKYSPGDEVSLKILRDGKQIIIKAVLGEWE